MSEGQQDGDDQRRQPRNLQGLLKFCTEVTVREDAPSQPDLAALDPERRQFLEEALSSLTVNVAKQLAESVASLCAEAVTLPNEDITRQEEAIQTIEDHVDDLNHAMDLHKMGGFPVLVRCLDSPHASLRVGAAGLIGDVCQNHLYCQENMVALGAVPALLHTLDTDADNQARVKAFYAVSCIIRHNPKGEEEFMKHDGFSYLMRAMQSRIEKLVIKAAFLLTNLIIDNSQHKEVLVLMGYVEQLCSLLSSDLSSASREHCTAALLALASHPPALAECRRPELNLRAVLQARLAEVKEKEEMQEEESYVKDLLKLLGSGSSSVEDCEAADR